MRILIELSSREKTWSFIVLLIVCAVLASVCLFSAFEPSPFDAWANSSVEYESERQAPGEKQPTESTSPATTESDEASEAGSQPASGESEQIAPFGEQIGPWYATQDKAIDELMGAIDRRLLFESPRIHLPAPFLFGISLAGVLAAGLFIHCRKGERT